MKKMKKLMFALQTMVRGGVEKELITVLKHFDDAEYEITLLLLYVTDEEIVSEVPSNVKMINLNIDKDYYCSGLTTLVQKRIQKGHILEAASITAKRFLNIGMTQANISLKQLPSIDDFFDAAVCYHIHSPIMLKYIATKVKANKKIGWIHNDFNTSGYPVQNLKKYLAKYDQMVAVSHRVREEFVNLCSNYSGTVSVAHNIVDSSEIRYLSQNIPEDPYFKDKHVKILSVGRFTRQKGFDIAIEMAKDLKDRQIDFHWYLVGYGEEESLYRRLIHQYGLKDEFIILGKKVNPYPYIANCDIYVQSSRYEAYSMTILEAKAFCKPIVCFDFAGSDEQIENGKNGYIVSMKDKKKFENRLQNLIYDDNDRKRIASNLRESVESEKALESILKVFR